MKHGFRILNPHRLSDITFQKWAMIFLRTSLYSYSVPLNLSTEEALQRLLSKNHSQSPLLWQCPWFPPLSSENSPLSTLWPMCAFLTVHTTQYCTVTCLLVCTLYAGSPRRGKTLCSPPLRSQCLVHRRASRHSEEIRGCWERGKYWKHKYTSIKMLSHRKCCTSDYVPGLPRSSRWSDVV